MSVLCRIFGCFIYDDRLLPCLNCYFFFGVLYWIICYIFRMLFVGVIDYLLFGLSDFMG